MSISPKYSFLNDPDSGIYFDGGRWHAAFDGVNVNIHGLWAKVMRRMFWKIPIWVDKKIRPDRYIDAGFFYCPYIPLQFSTVSGGGFFVGSNYYPLPANMHTVWAGEMRTIMRKWVPVYPKRPGISFSHLANDASPQLGGTPSIGFKTRYD